jgi:hypothetical protein
MKRMPQMKSRRTKAIGLVSSRRLPPLHIKLGLVKCFVKAMNKNGAGFKYVQTKFSRIISEAKIKEGVFDGPQIRELLKDRKFEETLTPAERNAWQS